MRATRNVLVPETMAVTAVAAVMVAARRAPIAWPGVLACTHASKDVMPQTATPNAGHVPRLVE